MLSPVDKPDSQKVIELTIIVPRSISIVFEQKVFPGGGQEAMDVTTTSTRIGKFDARFFHMVFEEGRVKGHFGPINSVAFHPMAKGWRQFSYSNIPIT